MCLLTSSVNTNIFSYNMIFCFLFLSLRNMDSAKPLDQLAPWNCVWSHPAELEQLCHQSPQHHRPASAWDRWSQAFPVTGITATWFTGMYSQRGDPWACRNPASEEIDPPAPGRVGTLQTSVGGSPSLSCHCSSLSCVPAALFHPRHLQTASPFLELVSGRPGKRWEPSIRCRGVWKFVTFPWSLRVQIPRC